MTCVDQVLEDKVIITVSRVRSYFTLTVTTNKPNMSKPGEDLNIL